MVLASRIAGSGRSSDVSTSTTVIPSGPETGQSVAVSSTGGLGDQYQNAASVPSASSASRISAMPPTAAPLKPALAFLGGSFATCFLRHHLVHLAVGFGRRLESLVDRLDLIFENLL